MQACGNFTPPELSGLWRGILIQEGFEFGEYDFNFSSDSVMMKDASGQLSHGRVRTIDDVVIDWIDGVWAGTTMRGISRSASNGPETTSRALALSAPGADAPISIQRAMVDTSGKVFLLSQCNSWKAPLCNFSAVFGASELRAHALARKAMTMPKLGHAHAHRYSAVANQDPCNQYTNCSTCIGEHGGVCPMLGALPFFLSSLPLSLFLYCLTFVFVLGCLVWMVPRRLHHVQQLGHALSLPVCGLPVRLSAKLYMQRKLPN